jgi:uncharacterized protein DUF4154
MVALACLASAGPAEAEAQTGPGELEQQVKAAYLLNFSRYVEWPPGTFTADDDPMRLCVIGTDALTEVVRLTVEGRRSRGRPVQVLAPDTPGQAGDCHIAFVAPAGGRSPAPWLATLRTTPTLLVGEEPLFLDRGGMVAFVVVNETVRFAIDEVAVRRAGLQISSRVLTLATSVRREDEAR